MVELSDRFQSSYDKKYLSNYEYDSNKWEKKGSLSKELENLSKK